MTNLDEIGLKCFGHVLIKNVDTGEILVDKFNAINFENMSIAIANSIADRSTGYFYSMAFGNGGSIVDSVGGITYLPPNVTGTNAQLYNQTYVQIIDDMSALNTSPTNNYITVNHVVNNTYSDVVVTCTLGYNVPNGQDAFDNSSVAANQYQSSTSSSVTSSQNADFIFDEFGILGFSTNSSLPLLTHVIFHPIQKALNVSLQIVYTVRFYLS